MDGGDVLRAAGECQALLGAAVDRDWTAKLPHLDFTVAGGTRSRSSSPGAGGS